VIGITSKSLLSKGEYTSRHNSSSNNNSNNNNNKSLVQSIGSAEAIRRLESTSILLSSVSTIVLFPGDVLIMDPTQISNMIHTHRQQAQEQ
jgi:hypothetical protein